MPSRPGFYFRERGEFHLGDLDGKTIKVLRLGAPSHDSTPLVGNWTFDRAGDRAGFYYPAGLKFYLGTLGGEGWDRVVQWDPAISRGDVPLIGRWAVLSDLDEPGLYSRAESQFRMADLDGRLLNTFPFGSPGNQAIPLVGDWAGTHQGDKPALYHRDSALFQYFNSGSQSFQFGDPGNNCIPFVHDWNDSGRDRPGLYFPATSEFHFGNLAGGTERVVRFGDPSNGGIPIVGNWGAYSTFQIEVTENGQLGEHGLAIPNESTVQVVVTGMVAITVQPGAVIPIEQINGSRPLKGVIYEIRPQDPAHPVRVGDVELSSDAVPVGHSYRLTPAGQIITG